MGKMNPFWRAHIFQMGGSTTNQEIFGASSNYNGLKRIVLNRNLLFQGSIFRCELLVSGRKKRFMNDTQQRFSYNYFLQAIFNSFHSPCPLDWQAKFEKSVVDTSPRWGGGDFFLKRNSVQLKFVRKERIVSLCHYFCGGRWLLVSGSVDNSPNIIHFFNLVICKQICQTTRSFKRVFPYIFRGFQEFSSECNPLIFDLDGDT